MFSVELPINIFMLAAAILISGFAGFGLRSRQLRKKQFKIVELRKEMVENHAHILELQKENVALEKKHYSNQSHATVLAMNSNPRNFENQEVLDSAI